MSTYLTVVYDVDGLSIDEIKELTTNQRVSAMAWGHLQDAISRQREREACTRRLSWLIDELWSDLHEVDREQLIKEAMEQ